MSQTIQSPAPKQEEFDILEQAKYDATHLRSDQEQRYHEWLDKDLEEDLSSEEAAQRYQQAADDFQKYIESRPYERDYVDEKGVLHKKALFAPDDTEVGRWEYHDEQRDKHFESTANGPDYDSMSLTKLAKLLGQAELDEDLTRAQDLTDILEQKISDSLKRIKAKHPTERAGKKARTEVLQELLRLKDTYKQNHQLDNTDTEEDEQPPLTEEQEAAAQKLGLLERALTANRKDYAQAVAHQSRKAFTSRASKQQLLYLKDQYEEARRLAGLASVDVLRKVGLSDETIKELSLAGARLEVREFEGEKADARKSISESKYFHKIYDWWARQGSDGLFTKAGFKGHSKKALALGIVGLPIGVAAGAAGSFFLGPIIGAAAGAAVISKITRGLASAKLNKEAGNSTTVADAERDDAIAKQDARLEQLYNSGIPLKARHVIQGIEEGTNESIRRNRRRLLGAALITAAGATTGAIVGDIALNYGGSSAHHIGGQAHKGKTPSTGSKLGAFNSGSGHNAGHSLANHLPKGENTVSVNPANYNGYAYPWDYFAHRYGAAEATPKIEELARKAQAAGWRVNSFGRGINSIMTPSGQVYESSAGIVAALEHFDT